jgi:hypothetical protein
MSIKDMMIIEIEATKNSREAIQMSDIEYFQRKLHSALKIPDPGSVEKDHIEQTKKVLEILFREKEMNQHPKMGYHAIMRMAYDEQNSS